RKRIPERADARHRLRHPLTRTHIACLHHQSCNRISSLIVHIKQYEETVMRFIGQGLCGATMILAAGSAAAQSSVTLYGVADTFFQYLDNGGSHSYSQRSGGNTGSMFGLRGNENLGGGLTTVFDVESGYNINNGTFFADSTALFYRQAWVGLT